MVEIISESSEAVVSSIGRIANSLATNRAERKLKIMPRTLRKRLPFFDCEELEAERTILFLHSAKRRKSTKEDFADQIAFTVSKDEIGGELGLITFAENEDRLELMTDINDDTEPVGPVIVVKIKGGRKQFYWAFEQVEETQPAETSKRTKKGKR